MKRAFLMAAIAAAAIRGAAAKAAELPTFELAGLPMTPHQVAVTGASGINEQSAQATLVAGGMYSRYA